MTYMRMIAGLIRDNPGHNFSLQEISRLTGCKPYSIVRYIDKLKRQGVCIVNVRQGVYKWDI